jgi:hypothetical protein
MLQILFFSFPRFMECGRKNGGESSVGQKSLELNAERYLVALVVNLVLDGNLQDSVRC